MCYVEIDFHKFFFFHKDEKYHAHDKNWAMVKLPGNLHDDRTLFCHRVSCGGSPAGKDCLL
jgi:hypothetical protein